MFASRVRNAIEGSEVVFAGAVGADVTGTWTVPSGVTSVCILCVGGGESGTGGSVGNGGAGGALSYTNAVAVTPGESLTYQAGKGGQGVSGSPVPGGNSFVKRGSTVLVEAEGGGVVYVSTGGQSSFGTGTVKYSGGNSLATGGNYCGGGAAGYAGAGGAAEANGTGGSGGGGYHATNGKGSGGGGVGLFGQGVSGAKGVLGGVSPNYTSTGGGGGSGGGNGGGSPAGAGGTYGGGGGSNSTASARGGNGGVGAVRILWGTGRAFPSTKVDFTA